METKSDAPTEKKRVPARNAKKPPASTKAPNIKFTQEDYEYVVEHAELSSINLIHSEFNVEQEYFSDGDGRAFDFSSKLEGYEYIKDDGFAYGVFTWIAEVKDIETIFLSIKASYMIAYENMNDANEYAVREFVRRVGRVATYPYFRAHTANLSWESNTNIPIMPVISAKSR